jgi:protein TonB
MSAELHLRVVGQVNTPVIRALMPVRAATKQLVASSDAKPSTKILALVVFLHLFAFAALVNITPTEPQIKKLAAPMLVSLVSSAAPEPELAPLLPPAPKLQPEIRKQKPKPKVQEHIPMPTEQVAVAQEPPSPLPLAPVVAVLEKAPEVVKPPLPSEEPEIEPPRFGVAYLENPSPAYPALSRRLGEEGRVLLRVLVSEDGNADTVQVEAGSGSGRLDQAALEAVKKWRFIPAKRNNQPISAYVIVPIKFSLES